VFLKSKSPAAERPAVTDRLVDANRLFERDVLLEEPRRQSKPRSSIIGDKKLTARDVVTEKPVATKTASKQKVAVGRPLVPKQTAETPSATEKRSRVVFDDPIMARPEPALRRERGYNKVLPQGGAKKISSSQKMSAVDEVRARVSRKIIYRGLGLMLLLTSFAGIAWFASEPLARL
jgi:hypothetical protein